MSATLAQPLGLCPSPTLGARTVPVGRLSLHRTAETVGADGQQISVKCGWLGDRLVTATPEFADVARAAAALGCSERAVLTAANHNFSLIRSDYQLASHSRQSDRSTPAGRSHRERRV